MKLQFTMNMEYDVNMRKWSGDEVRAINWIKLNDDYLKENQDG